jgi:protein involved in polysaccharide export with SLBB domain
LKKIINIIIILILINFSNSFSLLTDEDKDILMIESLSNASLAPLTYTLGPGDILSLHLWGNTNAFYTLGVSQNGTIFIPKSEGTSGIAVPGYTPVVSGDIIPALGEIYVEGLTVNECKERIAQRVEKIYRGVHVYVSLFELRAISTSIHGNIRDPGTYSITPLYRLSNFIDLAGGINQTGSYRNIVIESEDGTIKEYDLYEFLYKGNMEQNPFIKNRDRVIIPQAEMTVRITGRVLKTGNFELKEGDRLKDLIEMAGGFKKRGSLTRSIKIYNIADPDSIVEIDPYGLLIENDFESNVLLRTGDVVSIPMEPFTVTVVGQVTQGGTFEYEPGADFNYYLGLAGGYGERANEGDIRITRWDGERLKWKRNVEIKPGDTIVIGRSELKGWRDYLEVGLNAANLFFIIWTVSGR